MFALTNHILFIKHKIYIVFIKSIYFGFLLNDIKYIENVISNKVCNKIFEIG